MTWNYRIVKHEDGPFPYYTLHEVYYDAKGNPDAYAETGDPCGDTPDEVIQDIERMLKDAKKCKKDILSAEDFKLSSSMY